MAGRALLQLVLGVLWAFEWRRGRGDGGEIWTTEWAEGRDEDEGLSEKGKGMLLLLPAAVVACEGILVLLLLDRS